MIRIGWAVSPQICRRCLCAALVFSLFLVIGCRSARTIRDPEYALLSDDIKSSEADSHPEIAAEIPVVSELSGTHTVDEFVHFALAQSPLIQAARKRVEASGHRVPQAASLDDPMLGVNGYPFSPYVLQTAGGRSTVNVMASQTLPWSGKLETKAEAAEAETDKFRAELAAAELEIIEQVKRAYYDLSFLQQAISITEQSRELMLELSEVAAIRYRTGAVSQQDVLRAQVEVSNIDSELIRLRQQLQSSRARLAQLLHISPETPLQAVEEWPEEDIPQDLDRLYHRAIAARPELHAQLAAVRRDRHQVDLARLQYYPDVTLSAMWGGMTRSGALSPTADGLPMVNIGAQVNVPLYYNKLQAGVREAEAQAVSSAREYDVLKDRTQADVKDLYAQALSQRDLVALFRTEILPKTEQTLEVSLEAYRVGQTDFLQLVDNWRQLLRFQVMLHQQESQLRQTLSTLERVVGGSLLSTEAIESEPAERDGDAALPEPMTDVPAPPPNQP